MRNEKLVLSHKRYEIMIKNVDSGRETRFIEVMVPTINGRIAPARNDSLLKLINEEFDND